MKKLSSLRRLPLAAGCAMLALVGAANAAQRPITDWTSRQGTYCLVVGNNGPDCQAGGYHGGNCFLFVPPVLNYLAWTTDPVTNGFSMDYVGLANAWLEARGVSLGTTLSGSVNEILLANGTAMVSVVLQTHNALSWAIQGTTTSIDFGTSPLLFGYRAPDVLAGATPALGDCTLQLTFINIAPGAPLPDLIQLINCPEPTQAIIFLGFSGQAHGPLRAAFGVPEGTPGFVHTRQTGLIRIAGTANPASRVAFDGFPAEKIIIQVIGH